MSPAQYKAKREQLGLTQAGLASLLGVTRETVNRRESGEQPITHEAALAIGALRPAKTKRATGTFEQPRSDTLVMKTRNAPRVEKTHENGRLTSVVSASPGSAGSCPDCREEWHQCLCELANASECGMCDGSGLIDGYDDDPNWYAPGEMKTCPQCGGAGQ